MYGLGPKQWNALPRPLTANLRWRPFSSVPHVSDRLELDNNNRASWILHPGPSESDVYSDVVQEARWNDLLHTARLLIRLDTPLHGNNARGAKYAVYYASVATHPVFENIKMAALWAMSEEKSCSPFPYFFIPCTSLLTWNGTCINFDNSNALRSCQGFFRLALVTIWICKKTDLWLIPAWPLTTAMYTAQVRDSSNQVCWP